MSRPYKGSTRSKGEDNHQTPPKKASPRKTNRKPHGASHRLKGGEKTDVKLDARLPKAEGRQSARRTVADSTRKTKASLTQNEILYRSLVDAAQDAIFVVDRKDRILYANSMAERLFNVPPGGLAGKVRGKLFPPQIATRQKKALDQVFETGETFTSETKFPYPRGEMWTSTVLSPIRAADGRITAVLGIARDIENIKQAEQALRANDERFRATFEQAAVGVQHTSLDGHFLHVNKKLCEITGYSREELLAKTFLEITHPEDLNLHAPHLQQLLNGEVETFTIEKRYRRKEGDARWVEVTVSLVRDANGAPEYLIAITQDIDRRKAAENALAESEDRFRSLYQNATLGMYRTTPDGRILLANPALVRMMGYESFDELAQRDLEQDIYYGAEEPRSRFLYLLEKYGEVRGLESAWTRKDASRVYVRESARAIRDESGSPVYFEGTVEDITDRKLAELAVQQSQRQLQTLISNLPGIAYRCRNDANWTMEFISDGCRDLTGYPAEDFIDNQAIGYENLIAPEDRSRVREEINAAGARGEPYEIVYRILRADREERWVWEKGRSVGVDDDGHEMLEGFVTDITDLVRRQRALETLHAGGLTLGRSLNPREIGEGIIRVLEERLNWHHAAVRVRKDGSDEIELLAFSEPHAHSSDQVSKEEKARTRISRLGEGMSGWVIAHGDTVRSGNLADDPRYMAVFEDMASGLYVPIKSADRVLGCISVEDDRPNAFSEEDERVLATLASQAAVALENSRLFEAEQLRRQDAETLRKAAAALASSLDADKVIDELLEGLAQVIPYDSATVFIKENGNVRAIAGKGLVSPEKVIGRVFPAEDDATRRIWESNWPVIIRDVADDPQFADWGTDEPVRGWMGVPLIVAGNAIGYLSLDSVTPDAYDEANAEMAMAFASHAAAAIENARLFEQTRRRVGELEALTKASKALTGTLDPEPLLEDILRAAAQAIPGAQKGTIMLRQEGETDLHVRAQFGYEDARLMDIPFDDTKGYSGRAFHERRPILSVDSMAEYEVPFDRQLEEVNAVQSAIVAPLIVKDEAIGVIALDNGSRKAAFDEDDLALLTLFASSAAAALENARLFEQTRRRADEFAALYEITREFTLDQDPSLVLQTVVEHATRLMHTSVGGIYMYDAARNDLVMAVNVGLPSSVGIRLAVGEGAAGRVARTRETLIVDDYQTWEGRSSKYQDVPFRAVLDVPMIYNGELIGVLTVNEIGDSRRRFTEADARLLSLFAGTAAGAVYSARLFEQLQQRIQQLSALHSIDMVISASTDLRVNLKVILETAVRQLKADAVCVLLLNPVTLNLEYTAGTGFTTPEITKTFIRLGEGSVGRIALSKETLILPNLAAAGQDFTRQKLIEMERFVSYIGVPLVAKGQMKGILEVYHRTPFETNGDWMAFLNLLGGQTAIAVDNSLLFENLERLNAELMLAYDATIEGWSQALEMRGSETLGHSRRVLDWTLKLVHEMGVRERELQHIRRGTLLHDIGKMGIPDEILHKPASLTEAEWEIMRKHPQYAYDLLSPITYLRPALEIPYSHHEKWDGTGYPRGLKGEEIPLAARIFAVVDVYDALISDRPYRKAWPEDEALEYIQTQAGKHFDPKVVEAFQQMIRFEKRNN